jgi:hypothetical protein
LLVPTLTRRKDIERGRERDIVKDRGGGKREIEKGTYVYMGIHIYTHNNMK